MEVGVGVGEEIRGGDRGFRLPVVAGEHHHVDRGGDEAAELAGPRAEVGIARIGPARPPRRRHRRVLPRRHPHPTVALDRLEEIHPGRVAENIDVGLLGGGGAALQGRAEEKPVAVEGIVVELFLDVLHRDDREGDVWLGERGEEAVERLLPGLGLRELPPGCPHQEDREEGQSDPRAPARRGQDACGKLAQGNKRGHGGGHRGRDGEGGSNGEGAVSRLREGGQPCHPPSGDHRETS